MGFAQLYLSKVPMTAVDLLHDRVLPFYEAQGVVQQVEHRTTRVASPESNGMVERFNRTLTEEFFSVAYRKRLHESVEALQADLDGFLSFYNERRAHHGYRTQGRTPLQTFTEHQRAAEAPQAA
ncbi:MAG: integrase core domain-containing protein [Gemmatimonadales bacterium]